MECLILMRNCESRMDESGFPSQTCFRVC